MLGKFGRGRGAALDEGCSKTATQSGGSRTVAIWHRAQRKRHASQKLTSLTKTNATGPATCSWERSRLQLELFDLDHEPPGVSRHGCGRDRRVVGVRAAL